MDGFDEDVRLDADALERALEADERVATDLLGEDLDEDWDAEWADAADDDAGASGDDTRSSSPRNDDGVGTLSSRDDNRRPSLRNDDGVGTQSSHDDDRVSSSCDNDGVSTLSSHDDDSVLSSHNNDGVGTHNNDGVGTPSPYDDAFGHDPTSWKRDVVVEGPCAADLFGGADKPSWALLGSRILDEVAVMLQSYGDIRLTCTEASGVPRVAASALAAKDWDGDARHAGLWQHVTLRVCSNTADHSARAMPVTGPFGRDDLERHRSLADERTSDPVAKLVRDASLCLVVRAHGHEAGPVERAATDAGVPVVRIDPYRLTAAGDGRDDGRLDWARATVVPCEGRRVSS